ncbi:MAG: hypothetical protein ACYDC1_01825 [Limisphaerales bacterium]
MADFNPRLLREVQRDARAAARERDAVVGTVAKRTAEIAALQAQAAQLEARGDLDKAAAVRARLDEAQVRRQAEADQVGAIDERFREVLDRLRDLHDPCDADPSVPLALLPVRLETRFTPDRSALRIRIYPDDIHVDQLDPGVSDEEAAAGQAYWTAAGQGEAEAAAAWTTLIAAVHEHRALWVAQALAPTNLEPWKNGAPPEFPAVKPRSRRAAVARLLPDRFVAIAEQRGKTMTAVGKATAPQLVVGMLADDGSALATINGVKIPAGGEWMMDYDEALKAGLAITLPLLAPGATVDRLFVTGVRSSLDPAQTAAELTSLLASHRCARGAAFVPPGTASNNTEADRTEWQARPSPSAPDYLTGAAPADGSNAQVLAAALGIDSQSLAGLEHAGDRDQPQARAMNAALWGPSWGTLIERITQADEDGPKLSIPDATRESVRNFFRDSVRGRGPLPTLRIGDQPYGVLPVSSLDEKQWKADARDPIQATLLPLLRKIRVLWTSAAGRLPHVGDGGEIDKVLTEILGTSPVSMGVMVRTVLSDEARKTAEACQIPIIDSFLQERSLEALAWLHLGLEYSAINPIGSLEGRPRSLPFPMVHESDPAYLDGLLAGNAPRVESVLQALLALAWGAAKQAVEDAAPKSRFSELVGFSQSLSPARRERVLAVASLAGTTSSLQLHAEADALVAEVGEAGPARLAAFAPVETYRQPFVDLARSSTIEAARSELATAGVSMWMRAVARQAEVRESMQLLKETTLDQRRLLFAELLDLSSHRLDAWLTGIVERRRVSLRAAKPNGLMVGAYGWVENIVPGRGGSPEGGYLHAPSLEHAATAGVLRSAYLTHNPDASGDGAFAIDLSSARVRTAMHLIDGMRQGQPLGAILGYRIERRLHEERLDRFILTLRGLAPLVARRLSDRHDEVPPAAQESIAANNVVDGLRLIEKYQSGAAARDEIQRALELPPKDNPYLEPGQWPGLSAGEWSKIEAIIREADEAADAAADLLMAESVHQIVRGNTARASAALSAAGGGDGAPPEPEVIRTPSPGVPFTHRVLLVATPSGVSWNAARPRAAAEPTMEAWAASRLGDPTNVIVAVLADGEQLTLAATGLAALDVLYESADRRRLEQRIRAALPAMPVDALFAERRDPAWAPGLRAFGEIAALAASLREVLVNARPARPTDLGRPNDPILRTVSSISLDEIRERAGLALGGLTAKRQALLDTLPPPGVEADPVAVAIALEELAAYGVVMPMVTGENMLALAEVAVADALRRIETATTALQEAFEIGVAERVSQALFGDGFWMVPAIEAPAEGDLFSSVLSAGTIRPPRAEIRRFLRDVGSVREPLSRLSEALLLGDALQRPTPTRVAQLSTEAAPWVGGVMDLARPTPDDPIANLVLVDAADDFDGTGPTFALSIDQWTDVVPSRGLFGEGAIQPDDRRTSGLALNASAASARAPQSILLAVSPDGQRWTTDRVVAALGGVFELAKLRGVTLEANHGAGRILPALYAQSWSLQGEKVFDVRWAAIKADFKAAVTYVKEAP